MIDTTAILREVARERTELARWKALDAQKTATMAKLADDLATANAANDPAAQAKVQADLAQAATDLAADNDAAEAALGGTPPTP